MTPPTIPPLLLLVLLALSGTQTQAWIASGPSGYTVSSTMSVMGSLLVQNSTGAGAANVDIIQYLTQLTQTLQQQQQQYNALINNLQTQLTQTNNNLAAFVPVGTMIPFAGPNWPTSAWLPCDGRSVSRADYPALFVALGSGAYYGAADGSTFNLPHLSGRTAIGSGAGAGLTNRPNLGEQLGEEIHVLAPAEMPSHVHSIHDPGHTHSWQSGRGFNAGGGGDWYARNDAGFNANGPVTSSTTGITGTDASGGGNPHNNMQPSFVVNYIIKF